MSFLNTMHRLPTLLLGLSLVANAGLIWKLATSESASPATPAFAPAKSSPPTHPFPSEYGVALGALQKASLPLLAAQLRAADIDQAMIRAIIFARARAPYRDELSALEIRNDRWWRAPMPSTPEEKRNAARITEIEKIIRTDALSALGESLDPVAPRQSLRSKLAFLSPEKRAKVEQIEKDSPFVPGITPEQQAALVAEQQAELKALLTPQEYADYQLRFSDIARQITNRTLNLELSEKEYRALYAISETHAAQSPEKKIMQGMPQPSDYNTEASQQMRTGILQQLGPERGGEYLWGTNNQDYHNVKQIAAAANLPVSTAAQVSELNYTANVAAFTVLQNPQLSQQEKITALDRIATDTRRNFDALLPASVQAQLPARSQQWLSDLQIGKINIKEPINGSQFIYNFDPQQSTRPTLRR